MISKRNYFTILLMMVVLLFMFQFSQIVKENGNEYDTNEYVVENLPSGENTYQSTKNKPIVEYANGDYVLYVGEEESAAESFMYEWCTYTKRNVVSVNKLSSAMIADGHLPELLIVDAKAVDVTDKMDILNKAAEKGVTIIFASLPDVDKVAANEELQQLLGITEIRDKATEVEGLQLFSGFFLGGEAIYRAGSAEDEEKYQNFGLQIPWYITGKGTKTYMVGLVDEKKEKREDFPRIIWRNNTGTSMVFAVNGDYCESLTALGIYDACVYESQDYVIYPIVNAQCVSLANYPSMSLENEAEMDKIYARTAKSVQRDIMWPSIYSMASRDDLRMTCFIQTKYDFNTDIMPEDDQLVFYMQQFKEADMEAGKTLNFVGDTTYAEKYALDKAFYQKANMKYKFGAAYVDSLSDELHDSFENNEIYGLTTITCGDRGELPLLTYYTDDVTMLGTTSNVTNYSYRDDFELRGIQTALGYTNVLVDMQNVLWPETEDDQWQNYFVSVVSNMNTFFMRYVWFEPATMSMADARAREMLNLSYSYNIVGNTVILRLKDVEDDSYFLLRTHGEEIDLIEGAEFEEIEEDAYLIHTKTKYIVIALKTSDAILEYNGLF